MGVLTSKAGHHHADAALVRASAGNNAADLAAAEDGTPRLRIMANCENLIRTLPLLTFDEHNAEDVAGNAEDHAAEALRYGLMSRPVQARQQQRRQPLRYDPFAVPKRQGSVFQGL